MHWIGHFDDGSQYFSHEKATVVDNKIFSFGGFVNEKVIEDHEKTTVHIFDTDSLKWRRVNYKDAHYAPPILCGHSVVTHGQKVLLWGGIDGYFRASNLLYCYDTESSSWSILPVTGVVPEGAHAHSACIIGSYMYIFGGHIDSDSVPLSNEVHRLNLNTLEWEYVTTKGIELPGLAYHTASVIGNRMYIFAGKTMEERDGFISYFVDIYYNFIVYLDTSSMTWVLPICDGKPPRRRAFHSAAVYNDEIYFFGGFEGQTRYDLNELIKFEPATGIWREVHAKGEAPSPRRQHSTCVVKDQLFLFGGCSPRNAEEYAEKSLHDEFVHNYLTGHTGIYILDFFPSLKSLCRLKVLQYKPILDIRVLPTTLVEEIKMLKSPTILPKS